MEQVTMQWQERRLGRTLLRTYRDTVNLFDVFPNDKQPRMGPKEDPELQRQIEANEGIFEPLLLEPHPDNRDARSLGGWTEVSSEWAGLRR